MRLRGEAVPIGKTIAQKVLARAGGKESVEVGEIVDARVDRAMSHDNAALVSKHFASIGVSKVWDRDKIVLLMDHRVPANDIKTAEGHKKIREFVAAQELPNFFDIKEGICHQVLPEHGYALPGQLIVGTDSHTTTYGALGAFSTGIGATEMAGVWATGSLWLMVPKSIKISVRGKFPKGVYPKDLILKIIGDVKADGADYASVEYYGSTIGSMSVGGRMRYARPTKRRSSTWRGRPRVRSSQSTPTPVRSTTRNSSTKFPRSSRRSRARTRSTT